MVNTQGRLMEMLTGYAASHQHPFNVMVHMAGIPTIMLGVRVPLNWVPLFTAFGIQVTLAPLVVVALFLFYLTLDPLFALVFLGIALLLTLLAAQIAALPAATAGVAAAILFFGGYAAQFVGHAVEKSVPVVIRHPVQANLAAPFFTVVELCRFLGLRGALFDEVQRRIGERRSGTAAAGR